MANRREREYVLGDLDLEEGSTSAPRAAAAAPAPSTRPPRPEAPSNDNWRGRTDHFADDGRGDDPLYADADLPLPELEQVDMRARLSNTAAQRRAHELETSPARRAEKLAGHGPCPEGILGCAPYAASVVRRRFELYRERKQQLAEARALASRLDEALIDLGRALSSLDAPQLGGVKPELDAVLEARSSADAADQEAARARMQAEARVRELDGQIAELREAAMPYQEAVREAQAVHHAQLEALRKAEALLQRVDIELRALEQAQSRADPNRVLELNELRGPREAEARRARGVAAEGATVLEEAQKALAAYERQVAQATKQRGKILDEIAKLQRRLDAALSGAENQLVEKLRALARAALMTGVDAVGGDRARRARELEAQHADQLELTQVYDLALKCHDRGALWRGMALLVGTIAASVAAALTFS